MEKDCVNCKNDRICVMYLQLVKIQYETSLLKNIASVRQAIAETCDLYSPMEEGTK